MTCAALPGPRPKTIWIYRKECGYTTLCVEDVEFAVLLAQAIDNLHDDCERGVCKHPDPQPKEEHP